MLELTHEVTNGELRAGTYQGFQLSPHSMCVQWFCSQTVIPCGHWKTETTAQRFTSPAPNEKMNVL